MNENQSIEQSPDVENRIREQNLGRALTLSIERRRLMSLLKDSQETITLEYDGAYVAEVPCDIRQKVLSMCLLEIEGNLERLGVRLAELGEGW